MNPGIPPEAVAYYGKVAAYYDEDARTFESRSHQNPILHRIRNQFRRHSAPCLTGNVLEIGCGPGFDLIYWAQLNPTATLYGIDVSPGMMECANRNIATSRLANINTAVGTLEQVPQLFPGVQFQFAYCYFGALNTTNNLPRAAYALKTVLAPGAMAVLTFVNRWYLLEILYGLARLRFQQAFARLKPVWRGYAGGGRSLESHCFTPRQVRESFAESFSIVARRGYSILYPAWYRNPRWTTRFARLSDTLWGLDTLLNLTPAWCLGEYALYVLELRPPAR